MLIIYLISQLMFHCSYCLIILNIVLCEGKTRYFTFFFFYTTFSFLYFIHISSQLWTWHHEMFLFEFLRWRIILIIYRFTLSTSFMLAVIVTFPDFILQTSLGFSLIVDNLLRISNIVIITTEMKTLIQINTLKRS